MSERCCSISAALFELAVCGRICSGKPRDLGDKILVEAPPRKFFLTNRLHSFVVVLLIDGLIL